MYLLEHRGWERLYLGAGLVLYDTLGGAGAVPRHRHLTRRGARRVAPALKPDAAIGALTFYDSQCDDARHTMTVARTAAGYGAQVATGVKVVGFRRRDGRVCGVDAEDLEGGDRFGIEASHVVNAAGVWTDSLQDLLGGRGKFRVRASKGVHLVVPRASIRADAAFVIRAEREPQLFVRPWNDGRYWMFGTTDTKWDLDLDEPAVTSEDIDYLLRNVNRVIDPPLRREDIVGAFAGLRPLVAGETDETSRLSREHAVESPVPGLTAIAGGKYTTYRVMAKDAVDAAAPDLAGPVPPSCTEHIPLAGAEGYPAMWNARHRIAGDSGLSTTRVEHLLHRYGSLVGELLDAIRRRPELGEPIDGAPEYLRAEARYAASHEGALHLDDVLSRRLHVSIETADRGLRAAEDVGPIVGEALGWGQARTRAEIDFYRRRVQAELASQQQPDDRSADAARRAVRDPRAPAMVDGAR
ncbi:MAG: Glycerol-3-phosphate dehydrogenase [uncultured Solirubrobacteraceae bacterium]|uniref:glycerol-3-phosphate dehydrogenase n=1 Tax=uncultured Solirubrobacteraceae bacterium TaxID=1162706 RepID=A0A6J4T7K5_9ACTN|nr:MAG: Glycerol-3-phosphate dehydrogenase [uncultured Solirubrobacteraceae bacterium]